MAVASEEGNATSVVKTRSQHNQEVVDEEWLVVEVELERLVVELDVGYLCDNVLEVALLPGLCWVGHHRERCVVVLFVLVVEEDKLRPKVGLLSCTKNLGGEEGGGRKEEGKEGEREGGSKGGRERGKEIHDNYDVLDGN